MNFLRQLDAINIFKSPDLRKTINDIVNMVNWLAGRQKSIEDSVEANSRATRGIAVELTVMDADGKWEFKEMVWDPAAGDNGEWVERAEGITHDDIGKARPYSGPADDIAPGGTVGDVVYIRPVLIYNGAAAEYEFIPRSRKSFLAKITASSSTAPEHTFVELDSSLTELTDGLTAEDALEMNGRKGVPTDTIVRMHAYDPAVTGEDPKYYFSVSQGEQGAEKSLLSTGLIADTRTWDVEDQGSERGVEYDLGRMAAEDGSSHFFFRDSIDDATGNTLEITEEVEYLIQTDPSSGAVRFNHISMIPTNDTTNVIRLNEPQALSSTVTFTLNGPLDGSLTIDSSQSASHTMTFDDSGRYRDGAQTIDYDLAVDLNSLLPSCSSDQMLIYDGADWVCISTVDCPT